MRPEDLLARLEAGHEYDPMYGQLCNERDQLKAENAKLRQQLADVTESIGRVEERCAKLRELVHGLNHCITWASEDGKDCRSCPLWHEKDCTAEDIERELGIEDDT